MSGPTLVHHKRGRARIGERGGLGMVSRGPLDELPQGVVHRGERVGVSRVRWLACPFKVRPLVVRASPGRIGLTHQVLQEHG
jgi:hypothetical protein